MAQSFHAGATPQHTKIHSNRRRTDLTPTITLQGVGTRTSDQMTPREISRSGTPGRKMLAHQTGRSATSPGKAVSMSRLDQLARPRVLNLNPHQPFSPTEVTPSHAQSRNSNARVSHRRDKLGLSPSKKISASMGHLTGPINCSTAQKMRQRVRPPLSASASTRSRLKAAGNDNEGRYLTLIIQYVGIFMRDGSSFDQLLCNEVPSCGLGGGHFDFLLR